MSDLHQRLLAELEPLDAGQATSVTLVNHVLAALRAVVELHAPTTIRLWDNLTRLVCEGCDCGLRAEEEPDWPCSTIRTIADQMRIDVEDSRAGDR